MTETIDDRLGTLASSLTDGAAQAIHSIDSRLTQLTSSLTDGTAQAIQSIDSRLTHLTTSLTTGAAQAVEAVDERIASVTDSIDGRSAHLTDTITARFQEIHQGIESRIGAVATDIDTRVAQFEDLLGSRIEAVAGRIESSGRQASDGLMARAEELSLGIKSHVEDAERSLTNLVVNTSETIQTGARAAQQSLLSVSSDVGAQLKLTSAEVERALTAVGTGAANSILTSARDAQIDPGDGLRRCRQPDQVAVQPTSSARSRPPATATAASILASAREVQTTLVTASSEAANHVKTLSADIERSLSIAGRPPPKRSSPARAKPRARWSTASSDAANHVKSLASDVERTLTAVGADTAASILGSAREAQSSLHATSADAASQIKAISTEIERSLSTVTANTTDNIQTSALNAQNALVAASNEVCSKVKSTSADVERSVLAASSAFGLTMTGKTDEIVSYVQQQTDRLSQMIDGKRGTLVEAIGAKTNQLTVDIDRVTADALKSIETRGQTFSQSMLGHGSDVARTITSAGELATDAVNKSLKELEQSSRTAIDQSRQVSVAAVTEMQETSKILRTDTVALFERLREGNILLQEVLTGAHDNLNSLERALVTRVADFVSAMNDVTSRNGIATQTLEDQLKIFNTKTQKALEDLGSLSGQFEHHGQALVEAAAVVEQSNRNTTASVAERKTALESLVTTIDLRTADLDQRLSRFTGLLDESLAAAEERARDIARVVAETAGAGSAAISRPVRGGARQRRGGAPADRPGHERYLSAEHAGSGCDVQALRREVRHHGGEHEADGLGNAPRARGHPQRASPRRAGNAAGGRRKHRADAQGDRRPDRGSGGTEPDRGPSRPRPRCRHPGPRQRAARGRADDGRRRRQPRRRGPRPREAGSASTLPPPDLGMPASRRTEAPPVSPASADQGRDGWLSDLLSRTDAGGGNRRCRRADVRRSRPQAAIRWSRCRSTSAG